MPKVYNVKDAPNDWRKRDDFVYIGRVKHSNQHFGNPFSHKEESLAEVIFDTRNQACTAFEAWLKGLAYGNVEPERRQYILDNLHTLKGKNLVCFCKPLKCHGDYLLEITNEYREEDSKT